MKKKFLLLFLIMLGLCFSIYRFWWIPKKEAEAKTFLDGSLNKIKNINSLKYGLTWLSDGLRVSTTSVFMKKNKDGILVRNENRTLGGSQLVSLWNSKENSIFVYDHSDNFGRGGEIDIEPNIEGSEANFEKEISFIEENKPIIIGRENLDGKECLVFESKTKINYFLLEPTEALIEFIKVIIGNYKTKHWIWIDYGIPIKTVSPIRALGGSVDNFRKEEWKRENIEINIDIPDDLFKLPDNVTIKPFSDKPAELDETVDLQTYRNEKYGIEFKYPTSWIFGAGEVLSPNLPDQTRNFIQINISNSTNTAEDESSLPRAGYASVVYQVGKLRENQQTFDEFVNYQIENPERGSPPAVTPQLIEETIDGNKAFKIEEAALSNFKREFYYVEQSSERYMTISVIWDKDKDKLLINQILSTFKFLD